MPNGLCLRATPKQTRERVSHSSSATRRGVSGPSPPTQRRRRQPSPPPLPLSRLSSREPGRTRATTRPQCRKRVSGRAAAIAVRRELAAVAKGKHGRWGSNPRPNAFFCAGRKRSLYPIARRKDPLLFATPRGLVCDAERGRRRRGLDDRRRCGAGPEALDLSRGPLAVVVADHLGLLSTCSGESSPLSARGVGEGGTSTTGPLGPSLRRSSEHSTNTWKDTEKISMAPAQG